jgi:hypothetical protein
MTNKSGFALIVTVLIFGSMMLALSAATVFSLSRLQSRERGWESGLKAQSLAEACAEYALLQLRLNDSYTGNENVTIDGSACTIRTITTSGTEKTIQTEATVDSRHYRLQIKTDDDINVTSWQRVTSF